jgi:hypothetical protein
MPVLQNAVMNSVSPENIGNASGTFNMPRQLGGVFGIAVLVAVFAGSGSYASPHGFSDGFVVALAVCSWLSLAGALAALALPGRVAPAANPASEAVPAAAAEPAGAG